MSGRNSGAIAGQRLLSEAAEAPRRGEPVAMIEALAASGYLDGLVRRLRGRWSALPPHEIDECVAQAVDSALAALSEGKSVRDLGAWLWKTAQNKAQDRWQSDFAMRSSDPEIIDGVTAPERHDDLTLIGPTA